MNDKDTQVIDAGDLRKYRTEIPNSIDDMGLSVYAYRLYGHLKRVAGDSGKCWQSTATLAQACNMSAASVSRAKKELEGRLIDIEIIPGEHGEFDYHIITIRDIWAENFSTYSPQKQDPSHHRNRTVSQGKQRINPIKKEPIKDTGEKTPPVESAYRERTSKALAEGIRGNGNGSEPDLSTYPEEVRPYLEIICELWHLRPPTSSTSKGFWIKQGREVADACGEFGPQAIRAYRTEFETYMAGHNGLAPHTVEGPASLVKVLRAAAGRLREGGMAAQPLTKQSSYLWARGQPVTYQSEVARLEAWTGSKLDDQTKARIAQEFTNGEWKGKVYA